MRCVQHAAVIIGHICGIQFSIVVRSSVGSQELLRILIRSPYRGQAGGLSRHDVDAVPVICSHSGDAGSYEFHYFILHIALLEYCADDRKSDILRSDVRSGLAVEVDRDYAGISNVISIPEELLAELSAAFADGHRAERAVTGVGVGAQDHLAAAGHHLTHVLMDNADVRRNIDAAVLLSSREAKHVVIFVDRAADRAQGVVAVGQNIGQQELFHSGSSCCLDDSYESDVMGCHRVEPDAKVVHVIGYIVCLHDRICDRSFFGLCRISLFAGHLLYPGSLCLGDDFIAINQIYTAVIQFNHCLPPVNYLSLWLFFILSYRIIATAKLKMAHTMTLSGERHCCEKQSVEKSVALFFIAAGAEDQRAA